MNVIRETHGKEQFRILENFWDTQINSKQWIIDVLDSLNMNCYGSVYIFGGWLGVLGGMLRDRYSDIHQIYSIDVDSYTKSIGEKMNPDVTFIISDMKDFSYHTHPSLIINTSTEHITQETFSSWTEKIPKNVPVVLQGNNFYSCEEHIRCAQDLGEFKVINNLKYVLYSGEKDCLQYNRFMTIGYPHGI